MALSKNTFNRGQGGLGRTVPSADGNSGFIAYPSSLATSSLAYATLYKLQGISDLQNLGVNGNFQGETKATGTVTVTSVGTNGDTLNLTVVNYDGAVIDLGTITKTATETTVTLVAALIVTTINSGTINHGFTASNLVGVVTITAAPGLGVYTSAITATLSPSATLAVTTAAFSAGVASVLMPIYYHVSEFFRLNVNGILYLYLPANTEPTSTSADILALQQLSLGVVRQVAIYSTLAYANAKVTNAQTAATTLEGNNYNTPLSVVATYDFSSIALASIADTSTLNSKNVSVNFGQDAGALGYKIFKGQGKTIGSVGAELGVISLSKVSDSIGWKAAYNVTDGTELNTVAIGCTGAPQVTTLSPIQLDGLDNMRYNFLIKGKTIDGTFFNSGNTATLVSSDYAYIENNRTIDKGCRLANQALEPFQQSPIILNSDGTISDVSAAAIEGAIDSALDIMLQNTELSAKDVQVPTVQNVLATGKVTITILFVPVGVARQFVVNIGFTPKLA